MHRLTGIVMDWGQVLGICMNGIINSSEPDIRDFLIVVRVDGRVNQWCDEGWGSHLASGSDVFSLLLKVTSGDSKDVSYCDPAHYDSNVVVH